MSIAAKTYTESLQEIVEQYRDSVGHDKPFNLRLVAAWALQHGLLKPAQRDVVSVLAREIGQAMRVEVMQDPQGRTVRRKHARKIQRKLPNGEYVQETLWDDMTTAEPEHMHVSFQQRRKGIVGDNFHLKQDVDSYNENWNPKEAIPISYDYREDLEELEQPTEYQGEDTEPKDEDEEI